MQIRRIPVCYNGPFAVTLHAKQQLLDWYLHMKNLFIRQMTKVLAGTPGLQHQYSTQFSLSVFSHSHP